MKPFIENVLNEPGYSWLLKTYSCHVNKDDEFACSWHYHAEYELVLYLDPDAEFHRTYFAGDKIGEANHNTLVLYGPGLPHMLTGRSKSTSSGKHNSIIIWLTQHWLDSLVEVIPEAKSLKKMMNDSSFGLIFSTDVAEVVSQKLKGFEKLSRHYQSLLIIELLFTLADDTSVKKLSNTPYKLKHNALDPTANQKFERASRYIEDNYYKNIQISNICSELHISKSSAYRLFEKHYGQNFSEHLKLFRIGKACELLTSTSIPIALIAEQTGFRNLSNFNRQFKSIKDLTPTQFRAKFR